MSVTCGQTYGSRTFEHRRASAVVIHYEEALCQVYAPLTLRLPSQPQRITVHWLVRSYTIW